MKINEAGMDIVRRERAVTGGLTVPLNENEYSALASFTQSVGPVAFWGGMARVLANRKDWRGTSEELARAVKIGGRVSAALIERRKEEARLFVRPALVADNRRAGA
jgi:lysozyme